MEGWRRWVKGLDDAEEKRREEGREIVVEEVKVEKKQKVERQQRVDRGVRGIAADLDVGKIEQRELEQKTTGRGREASQREREEKEQVKLEVMDLDEGMEEGEGEHVEVVVVPGGDGRSERSRLRQLGPALPRFVDAAPCRGVYYRRRGGAVGRRMRRRQVQQRGAEIRSRILRKAG